MDQRAEVPPKGEKDQETGLAVRRVFAGDRGSREVVRSLLRAHGTE